MPVLSRFYGITIRMYFQQSEHNPPHIHAIYGEHVAAIALELVKEWISIHEKELKDIWDTQNFKNITPLE